MKHIVGWTILIALIPLAAMGQSTGNDASPLLYVPEPLFNFETVVSGRDVSHDYIVQNKGTAPLEISRVKTG